MNTLFLLSAGFCLYTYVLFPLSLWMRVRRLGAHGEERDAASGAAQRVFRSEADLPSVSIVIAAHDEIERLPAKLASLLGLDYPRDRFRTIIVSDGSTDGTRELLEAAMAEDPTLHVIHYDEGAGKPTALNVGVAAAEGEILVFMDARQRVSPNALRALVRRLEDPGIGAVSGELVLAGSRGDGASVSLYWRYEKWIRQSESRLFSTTGATGALYAIRREHWVAHAPDVLVDDFETPVHLLRRGLRTVFEPAAQAFDIAESESGEEFRRKVRTLAGNYQSFRRHPWLFDPRRNPVWWQFLSHKVFRLLVPYALLGAFLSALLGNTPFLRSMLVLQMLFYAVGVVGFAGVHGRLPGFVRTFLQLNAAAVIGAWRYVTGEASVRWRRT